MQLTEFAVLEKHGIGVIKPKHACFTGNAQCFLNFLLLQVENKNIITIL